MEISMRTLVEQILAEGRARERRSRAISRVFDIALPVLIVLCLLLWRERYNVIEVKNGEISLTQIYAWGCCARELKRMPASEVASVSMRSFWGGGGRGSGGYKVEIYNQAGEIFDVLVFSNSNYDLASEKKECLLNALSGKSTCRASHSTQTRYFMFALVLTIVTVIRWWMIKTVRKADEEQDRQWEDKRKSRAQKSHLNDPGHVVSGKGRSKCLSANRSVQFRKGADRNHKTV
jgi:hypothetical protein